MRNIRIIVFLLLVTSCKFSAEKEVTTFNLGSSLTDGELTLSVNDKTQLLKEEGDIVDFHSSPDNKSIVLGIRKLSTLSILKIYKWDMASEKYVADTTNINKVAWQNFEQSKSIAPEELEASHVYFMNWKGKDSIVVELRGNAGMGEFISDTMTLNY